MKIISIVLILTTAFLSFRHGWSALQSSNNPEQLKMMADQGINKVYVPVFGVVIIIIGILVLFPQTFIIGNLLNAFSFILIMAFSLNAGNTKMALIEIPFLAMPLVLIWLKHPFPKIFG